MGLDTAAKWKSPDWRAAAEEWVLASMASADIRQTGPIAQPRVRFWSTQLTVETDAGRLWFKANNPSQTFEARLVHELSSIVPEYVVPPLAIDAERGWMLSLDQGETLYGEGRNDRAAWARMVADFVDVQQRLVDHEQRLLDSGLAAFDPRHAPDFLERLLTTTTALPAEDPRRVDAELAAQVTARLDLIVGAAQRLADGPVPYSLEHNDLHNNNAFGPSDASSGSSCRFFDFGDAVWAHPFTSLAVPLERMCAEWEVPVDHPDVRYVVDAYRDAWDVETISTEEAAELIRVALPFGEIHRLRTWELVLPYADDAALADFGGAVPGWLSRVVDQVDRAR